MKIATQTQDKIRNNDLKGLVPEVPRAISERMGNGWSDVSQRLFDRHLRDKNYTQVLRECRQYSGE